MHFSVHVGNLLMSWWVIWACRCFLVWEIYSWADELNELADVFLVFFLPQVFMVLLLWLSFFKRVSSIRPLLAWVTNSLVPARKTQKALNRPSSGHQYSGTSACVPSPFSMIINLEIFLNAGILLTCFCSEKICICKVFLFFCLSSGKTIIICYTWAALCIYTVGISNNKQNMKLLLLGTVKSFTYLVAVSGGVTPIHPQCTAQLSRTKANTEHAIVWKIPETE